MSNTDLVDTLNDLIETCKDGDQGFTACAENVKSPALHSSFLARATQCRQAAQELSDAAIQHGGTPLNHGTAAGAVHRGWVAVRGSLTGFTDLAMLEECERGEDVALTRYRKALDSGTLTEPLRAMVERQLLGLRRNHDEVRAARDLIKLNDETASL